MGQVFLAAALQAAQEASPGPTHPGVTRSIFSEQVDPVYFEVGSLAKTTYAKLLAPHPPKNSSNITRTYLIG